MDFFHNGIWWFVTITQWPIPIWNPFLPASPPGWRGIVVTVRAGGLAGGCQTCGTHIFVTAWRIFSIRSFVELSRPLVVHCHGHLPICPIWAFPWAKNLSNFPQIGSRLCGSHISWNRWMDVPRLKFGGLVWTCSCALSQLFAHLPNMGLPMGQKLVKSGSTWTRLCGAHIFETAGWIYTIRSSMELSRPVVVQHQGHLTSTLDIQGQILKSCISGMGGPVDMERKGCELIGCYTHIVTLNCDLTHDLDPWFSRSSFENVVTQQWDARLNGLKGMWVDKMLDSHCDF